HSLQGAAPMSRRIAYQAGPPFRQPRPIPYRKTPHELTRRPIAYPRSSPAPRAPDGYRLRLRGPSAPLNPLAATELLLALHALDVVLTLELRAGARAVDV